MATERIGATILPGKIDDIPYDPRKIAPLSNWR